MVVALWIMLALVPYLLGYGILSIIYRKKECRVFVAGECYVAGFCVLLGVTEATHLAGFFLRLQINTMAVVWALVLAAMVLGVLFVIKWPELKWEVLNGKQQLLAGMVILSVLLQVITIMTSRSSYREADMTLETVRTFLDSGQIYQVNPLTGQAYTAGVPLRIRILCLPTFYGFLSSLLQVDAALVVCRVIPVVVLLASYAVYYGLGKTLFGKNKTAGFLFLLVVSLLYWFGDYMDTMDSFLLMHSGYRGVAIRNCVLIPYVFSMCLNKRWQSAVLAILAEACIVWTLYGLGYCLASALLFLAIYILAEKVRKRRDKKCQNS